MTVVWVFAGGPAPSPRPVPTNAVVVAADSGADHCLAAGVTPDVVVGDLDSISPEALTQLRAADCDIVDHPVDKDASDLELALELVCQRVPGAEVTVVAGKGGRLDHELATLLLLGSSRWATIDLTAFVGQDVVVPVHDKRVIHGNIGGHVSLFAVGSNATGVTTEGLAFSLAHAVLEPGVTLGLSNVFLDRSATVSVGTGVVLIVVPA